MNKLEYRTLIQNFKTVKLERGFVKKNGINERRLQGSLQTGMGADELASTSNSCCCFGILSRFAECTR